MLRCGVPPVPGVLLVLVLLTSAVSARGQQSIDRRVDYSVRPPGRLLDANPAVGSAGLNYARPVSPFIGGNAYANGIVGQGLSLHSYSPIRDPTEFRAAVGSGTLYSFRRDSVSAADSYYAGVVFPRPYYDPSVTAPSAGFLQGLAGFSGAVPGLARPMDMRLQLRMGAQTGLESQIVGLNPQASLATSSGIFGLPPSASTPLSPSGPQPPWSELTPGGPPPPNLSGPVTPPERRRAGGTEALATPLDEILRGGPDWRTGVRTPLSELLMQAGQSAAGAAQPGLIVPERFAAARPVTPAATEPPLVDTSVLPGMDVFTDMRLALALSANPSAPWFREMQEVLLKHPELARQVNERARQDARQFVDGMLKSPVRTFTGGGSSVVNDQMLKAEALMDIGHYYEADDRYTSAHLADPTNPLPLIGKGHALLAAGDYSKAAFALVQGLERFPDVAVFPLDLQKLVGGGEVIDIRRADLMNRLEQRESPELRFLLGYLEYHTGDREHGLANLEHAAREDRAGSVISRYPALLRQGGGPPPAKTPTERPGAGITPSNEPDAVPEPSTSKRDGTLVVPPIPPAATQPAGPPERDRP